MQHNFFPFYLAINIPHLLHLTYLVFQSLDPEIHQKKGIYYCLSFFPKQKKIFFFFFQFKNPLALSSWNPCQLLLLLPLFVSFSVFLSLKTKQLSGLCLTSSAVHFIAISLNMAFIVWHSYLSKKLFIFYLYFVCISIIVFKISCTIYRMCTYLV